MPPPRAYRTGSQKGRWHRQRTQVEAGGMKLIGHLGLTGAPKSALGLLRAMTPTLASEGRDA